MPRKAKTTRGAGRAAPGAAAPAGAAAAASGAAAPAGAAASASCWADLPAGALGAVFDSLSARDVAAAACACRAWAAEAAGEARWAAAWEREVSGAALWRWARAAGGRRAQLRARALVRRGAAAAAAFPLARGDGPVAEVLLLDGAPAPRFVTVQAPRAALDVVRLRGSTVKVWTAEALERQRPLLVVHDVLKHLQLEDGRLFLFRIEGDVAIRQRCLDPGDAAGATEAARWAEHPAIRPALLDPRGPALAAARLDSPYGRGATALEWMDMGAGAVASGELVGAGAAARLRVRVLDLASGRCVRRVEAPAPAPPALAAEDAAARAPTVIMTRNAEAAGRHVLAAAALFDHRVFRWGVCGAWLGGGGGAEAEAAEAEAAAEGAEEGGGEGGAAGGGAPPPAAPAAAAAADADFGAALDAAPAGLAPAAAPAPEPESDAEARAAAFRAAGLRLAFSTPGREPIVDLSISSAAGRIYVVGLENLFLLGLDGAPRAYVSMAAWPGVRPPPPPGAAFAEPWAEQQGLLLALGPAVDVAAFSWPLPNSARVALFLDACSGVFVADFENLCTQAPGGVALPAAAAAAAAGGAPGEFPLFRPAWRVPPPAGAAAWAPPPLAPAWGPPPAGARPFLLQAHTDLRPPPPAATAAGGGAHYRAARAAGDEPVVVEYTQCGEVRRKPE
jgi:hypothetical protein